MACHQPERVDWMSESGKSQASRVGPKPGWTWNDGFPSTCPPPGGFPCTLCVPYCKLLAISLVVPTCLDIFEAQTLACSYLHLLSLSQFGFPGKQLEEIAMCSAPDWAEGEVGLQCRPNEGFSQPHMLELAEVFWVEAMGPALFHRTEQSECWLPLGGAMTLEEDVSSAEAVALKGWQLRTHCHRCSAPSVPSLLFLEAHQSNHSHAQHVKKCSVNAWADFLGSPAVKTLLLLQGMWVWFLLGELRSHMQKLEKWIFGGNWEKVGNDIGEGELPALKPQGQSSREVHRQGLVGSARMRKGSFFWAKPWYESFGTWYYGGKFLFSNVSFFQENC